MNEQQQNNEEKIINWKEFKRKLKVQEIKLKVKEVGRKALDTGKDIVTYAEEHKEGVAIVAAGLAGTGKLIHSISKAKEQRRKDITIYDHSSKQYMKLKRPLKQKEKLEAFERNQSGEKYAEIYRSMGLLKE